MPGLARRGDHFTGNIDRRAQSQGAPLAPDSAHRLTQTQTQVSAVWLSGLLLLAAVALLGKRCTPQPVVGDFPVLEWSSRDPVLASLPLPFVFGLVVPSDLPRMRAKQAKPRGLLRALPARPRRSGLHFRCPRRCLG